MTVAAGWYPDPTGRWDMRYFDGERWTAHVSRGSEILKEEQPSVSVETAYAPLQTPVRSDTYTTTRAAPEANRRRGRLIVLSLVLVLAIALLAGLVWFRSDDDVDTSSRSPLQRATTTTLSLEEETDALADLLRSALCPSTRTCVTAREGAIQVVTFTATENALTSAGSSTGLWSAADAARMQHTRALDGTQKSTNGSASWTYHPDHGLQIVIEVRPGSFSNRTTTTRDTSRPA